MLVATFAAVTAVTRYTFWVGNSMTYRPDGAHQQYGRNVPNYLSRIAAANGDTHYFNWHVVGGAGLCRHVINYNLSAPFAAAYATSPPFPYDAIVVQSIHGPGPRFEYIWYCAELIAALAKQYRAQVVLRASWAKDRSSDADLLNGLSRRISEASSLSARLGDVAVTNEGVGWEALRQANESLWLRCFSPDNFHPSALGSYYNALLNYNTLFGGKVVRLGSNISLPLVDGVNAEDAAMLADAVGAPLRGPPVGCGLFNLPPPPAAPAPPQTPPLAPAPVDWSSTGGVHALVGIGLGGGVLGACVGVAATVLCQRRRTRKKEPGVTAWATATSSSSSSA